MTPNIPLLRKAVEWAEAEAAKTDGTCMWNQAAWARDTDCGTTYCMAGYVVTTAHPTAQEDRSCRCGCISLILNGERTSWSTAAQKALGITDGEADLLFEGSNTIERVREVAEQIAARAGERL